MTGPLFNLKTRWVSKEFKLSLTKAVKPAVKCLILASISKGITATFTVYKCRIIE